MRSYVRPPTPAAHDREEKNNQRGAALLVPSITNAAAGSDAPGAIASQPDGACSAATQPARTVASTRVPLRAAPGQASTHPPWLPQLCAHMAQTSAALRQVHGALAGIDDEAAAMLSNAVEELLRELDRTTQALGRRAGLE